MDDSSISNSLKSPMLSPKSLETNKWWIIIPNRYVRNDVPLHLCNGRPKSLETNKWWIIILNKLIDVEEAKNQILFSLPMIVVTSCFYFINLVSVMFAGHLGQLELAASNLANSWAMVSGLAFMWYRRASPVFHSNIFWQIWSTGAFELLVLLAGIMPNSETTTSLIAMSVNTEAIAYTISYGLSAAASTRVANELGGGNIDKAKHAMGVTLKLSVLLALIVDLVLCFGHDVWAGLFSDSTEIINKFATMTPLLLISFLFDFFQGVLSGFMDGLDMWSSLPRIGLIATNIIHQMGKSRGLNKEQ
uniref:TRANSPARENT TESTA 12 protein n=1 Tax=Solanum tuberosum TaxID=4113 RepID=M1CCE6_SOLTU